MKGYAKKKLAVLAILVSVSMVMGCLGPEPKQRPPGTDGSARWAFDAALPRATSDFASDATLVEISGEGVMPDGRLAANTGKWILSFSSFSKVSRVPITVDFNRNVSIGSSVPPGRIEPLWAAFTDSPAIFAASAAHGASGTRKVEYPVVCRFDSTTGTHVWFIKFKVGSTIETHEVRWDGVWLDVR